jgi:hypothetical protein
MRLNRIHVAGEACCGSRYCLFRNFVAANMQTAFIGV